jgi:hypothetical protein
MNKWKYLSEVPTILFLSEGQCHKIFDLIFLLFIIFQAPEYPISTILIFFKNSLCYSKCTPMSTTSVFKKNETAVLELLWDQGRMINEEKNLR